MLDELAGGLARVKFKIRIAELETSAEELMLGVLRLVSVIGNVGEHDLKSPELPKDKDDVMFIECALTAKAEYIISGDPHLLQLRKVRKIDILTPADFLQLLKSK